MTPGFVATDTTLTLRLEAFSTADSPADESEFGYMGIDGLQLTLVTCPWDCGDGDGSVDIDDFLAVLAQWGTAGTCDFDGGGVGINDFLALLTNWGPCP